MVTVNKRVSRPQAMSINGVDTGGLMTARIVCGYDNVLQTPADGLDVPLVDRLTEYVRGTIVTQDWVHFIALLTGTVATAIFYERKSGAAEATGYIKHTLTNPIIHRVRLSLTHRGYASVSYDFECKPADPTKTIADMWAMTDSQNAPSTYLAAARGLEITAALHGTANIYHVTRVDFEIAMQLLRASHDGDIGYTAVDAVMGGISPSGSISFQDAAIASAKLTAQTLVMATVADLHLTVKQSQGATAQVITIANVLFSSGEASPSADGGYTEFTVPFVVANNVTTPLTLAGSNKIIAIA